MDLCSRYCSNCFVNISSFNLQNNPVGEGLFLSVLLQMKKLGCGEVAFSGLIQLGLECRQPDFAVRTKCSATSNNNNNRIIIIIIIMLTTIVVNQVPSVL